MEEQAEALTERRNDATTQGGRPFTVSCLLRRCVVASLRRSSPRHPSGTPAAPAEPAERLAGSHRGIRRGHDERGDGAGERRNAVSPPPGRGPASASLRRARPISPGRYDGALPPPARAQGRLGDHWRPAARPPEAGPGGWGCLPDHPGPSGAGGLLGEALAASPPVESGVFRNSDLVELVALDSSMKLDIRYAGSNNFLDAFILRHAPSCSAPLRRRWYGRTVGSPPLGWDSLPRRLSPLRHGESSGMRRRRSSTSSWRIRPTGHATTGARQWT